MWQNDLEIVRKIQQQFKQSLNEGASQAEIDNFLNHSKLSIPNEYIELLKKINGIKFNGFILYGIDSQYLTNTPNQSISGLEDLNETWHEFILDSRYLFIGQDHMSFYVYHTDGDIYFQIDNPGGDVVESSKTLDGMLDLFFATAIL